MLVSHPRKWSNDFSCVATWTLSSSMKCPCIICHKKWETQGTNEAGTRSLGVELITTPSEGQRCSAYLGCEPNGVILLAQLTDVLRRNVP
jgi:hypothetical protein